MKRRFLAGVVLGFLAIGFCSVAQAITTSDFDVGLAINFVGDPQDPPGTPTDGTMEDADWAGYWSQKHWNNIAGVSGTGITGLKNSGGGVTGVTMDFRSSSIGDGSTVHFDPPGGSYYSAFLNGATANQDGVYELWAGDIRHHNGTWQPGLIYDPEPTKITLTGLASVFSSYDAWVYFGNGGGPQSLDSNWG
jgi:hypothetical protein